MWSGMPGGTRYELAQVLATLRQVCTPMDAAANVDYAQETDHPIAAIYFINCHIGALFTGGTNQFKEVSQTQTGTAVGADTTPPVVLSRA